MYLHNKHHVLGPGHHLPGSSAKHVRSYKMSTAFLEKLSKNIRPRERDTILTAQLKAAEELLPGCFSDGVLPQ